MFNPHLPQASCDDRVQFELSCTDTLAEKGDSKCLSHPLSILFHLMHATGR